LPTTPRSWFASDFVTANLLNGELFWSGGQFFNPTGTRWHAYRPVYAAWPTTSQSAASSGGWFQWTAPATGRHPAIVVADSAGVYGTPLDAGASGELTSTGPALSAGSGAGGGAGGLYLLTTVQPMTGGTTTCGAGIGQAGLSGTIAAGTLQQPNSAADVSPFALDIQQLVGSPTAWMIQTGNVGAGDGSGHTTDGSGLAGRFQGFWTSVMPANGLTVSGLPSPVSSFTTAAASAFNSTIRDVMNLLAMPPLARAVSNTTQAIANNTPTVVTLGTESYDTYSAFASSEFTAPTTGLYLCHGIVGYAPTVASEYAAGININGTNFWGPACPSGASTGAFSPSKTQIFDLQAGDTVRLSTYQLSGGSQTIGGVQPSRLVILFLGATGTPSPLPTAPDVTRTATAGMSNASSQAYLNLVANDANFLLHRPYFLSYSTTNQTGLANNTASQLTCYNQVSGIVHATTGDNYSGWNASSQKYTAPANGWYLCIHEVYMALPTLTSTPLTIASFMPNPAGAGSWDNFQRMNANKTGNPGGATAVGLYYLRAGDTIEAGVFPFDYTSSTTSTNNNFGRNPHLDIVWISE
jgi:hypothetical protein